MCLVLLAIDDTSDYPIQLAANRDEYHARESDPLHWWPDRPGLLGGRDRQAGGTWLGASTTGRFATVLNDRRVAAPPGAPSRGHLVPGFLEATDSDVWLDELVARRARYAGFHLLAGIGRRVVYCASGCPAPLTLDRGLHAIDNDGLNVDDPRTRRARAGLGRLMQAGAEDTALLEALADTTPPDAAGGSGHSGPGDPCPVFIRNPVFGTRCSTVLRIDRNGHLSCHEHRFDSDGACVGISSETWSASTPGTSCVC